MSSGTIAAVIIVVIAVASVVVLATRLYEASGCW